MESITPAPILGETLEKIIILESKVYNLPTNDNNLYELIIQAFNNEKIHFKIRQVNKITDLSYEKRFTYEEITKILLLETNYYNNIQKIFKFCDSALNNNKVVIIPEIENYKRIKFLLKKRMDFDEVDCTFYLTEKINSKDEIIQILIDEINELKNQKSKNDSENKNNNIINNNDNNMIKELNDKITKLSEKNELMEVKLNSIIDENSFLRNKISEMEKIIKNLESKISNDNSNNKINDQIKPGINLQNNNKTKSKPPINLEFKEIITNSHSNSGWLRQFVVYHNRKDNYKYLAFNNKSNFNINILRIIDKQLIHYLKGHKTKVSVIKYFIKNNRDYLLSVDENKIAICWNLETYNQHFIIKTNMEGYIWDSVVLLNIKGYDLCIFPSNNEKEFTRAYNFNGNNELLKQIYGTYDNKTNYVIPWNYNNNYYLIELCSSKITINNVFVNENYAPLTKSPEGLHCCGYILKDIFLCVTDYQNNFIRIWNLPKLSFEREIKFEGWNSYGIIPWNDDYSIMACSDGLIIIDMNKGITVKKVTNTKAVNLCGIQKINSVFYRESIICSNSNGSIMMFNEQ